MTDVAGYFDRSNPGTITLWRRSEETWTLHRSPLFSESLPPHLVLGVDWLHCLSLGVYRRYNGALCWALFEADAWQTLADDIQSRALGSAPFVSADFEAWVAAEQAAGRQHTKLDLQFWRFGSRGDELKLYGAETNTFLKFTAHLVELRGASLGGDAALWLATSRNLMSLADIIRAHGLRVPDAECDRFETATRDALRGMLELGLEPVYKFHQLRHLSARIRWFGSPRLWACWIDEDYNQPFKAACRSAHRQVWENES